MQRLPPEVELVHIKGHRVTVRMVAEMPTSERGHLLLELEKCLRREWRPDAEVFLEPRGDMNKLRQRLRGVKV